MVRHVVMWRLNDASPKGKEAARAVLQNMDGKIPGMQTLEVGLNVNTTEAAYDIVLLTTHDSMADLEVYQMHPEHQKVKAYMSQAAFGRVVVDSKS